MLQKHLSAGTGSLVMESQQVRQTRPSDGGAGHRPRYAVAPCRRGTVPGIGGGVPPTPRSDPLRRQTDGQMAELRGPFPGKLPPSGLSPVVKRPLLILCVLLPVWSRSRYFFLFVQQYLLTHFLALEWNQLLYRAFELVAKHFNQDYCILTKLQIGFGV